MDAAASLPGVLTPERLAGDLVDLRRLVTFVESRRARLADTGQPTTNADAVLAKLRAGVVLVQERLPR